MKYIDAEKLIAEIETRIALLKGVGSKGDYAKGSIDADKGILEYITSLQQEQPERICPRCRYFDKKENCCDYPYDGRDCFVNENGVYKCNSFEEAEKQPEVDLEKEIMRYQREDMDRDTTVKDVAHHFYELGRNSLK